MIIFLNHHYRLKLISLSQKYRPGVKSLFTTHKSTDLVPKAQEKVTKYYISIVRICMSFSDLPISLPKY